MTTLPVREILDPDLPALWWLASLDRGDAILPLFSLGPEVSADRLVLTFDNLLQRSDLVPLVRNVLSTLTRHYHAPVDVEFAITLEPETPQPHLMFHLLQCRPQSRLSNGSIRPVPKDLGTTDELFVATRLVPIGHVDQIEYITGLWQVLTEQAPCSTQVMQMLSRVGRNPLTAAGNTTAAESDQDEWPRASRDRRSRGEPSQTVAQNAGPPSGSGGAS